MRLRELIFEVAARTAGVGELTETLRWGEPAYLTAQSRSGSTVRIAWKKSAPDSYAMYFICTTRLVDTFRSWFQHELRFDGDRAIVFDARENVPMDALSQCVEAALTYRLRAKR